MAKEEYNELSVASGWWSQEEFGMKDYDEERVRVLRSSNGYNTTEILPNMELWVVNDAVLNCERAGGD